MRRVRDARTSAKMSQNIAEADGCYILGAVVRILFDKAVGRLEKLRIEVPHGSDLRIGRDVLFGNKAKVIFYFIGDVRLHSDVRTARPSYVPEQGAFLSAVNVDRKLRVEENVRFWMAKFLPAVAGIEAVVSEQTNFALDLTNNVIFAHGILGFQDFPGRMPAIDIDIGISN